MAKSNTLITSRLKRAQSLSEKGDNASAITLLEKICLTNKRNIEAFYLLGVVYYKSGQPEKAVMTFQTALEINPIHILTLYQLGSIQLKNGNLDAAEAYLSKALKLDKSRKEIVDALVQTQLTLGQPKNAASTFETYLSKVPGDTVTLSNLAGCYFMSGELALAARNYHDALKKRKDPAYLDGLGATLCQQGHSEKAIEAHKEAVQLSPNNARFYSNLLLSMNYQAEPDPDNTLKEHLKWAEKHEDHNREFKYDNTKVKNRPINIGYVSPDFRTHSVAYFIEHLIQKHGRRKFNVYCYSNSPKVDDTTIRIKNSCDHWRDIAQLSDNNAAHTIKNDKIDILVDLSGHTAGNRLKLFALKPAPIQVTYVGYPCTTGLSNIDYRITDSIVDPEGSDEYCRETLQRLENCFLCYQPPADAPDIKNTPALGNNYITFGSFNNLAKINQKVVETWTVLLHNVDRSQIIIKNPSLTDIETAEYYYNMFENFGINKDRVNLIGHTENVSDHLNLYNKIDIGLDTFPYNGTTTTCEAIFMGIPVITLQGENHISRVSSSILTNMGLSEYIAQTKDEYISIATNLSSDLNYLNSLRLSLRNKLINSSMCDAANHTKQIESLYKIMWDKWCNN